MHFFGVATWNSNLKTDSSTQLRNTWGLNKQKGYITEGLDKQKTLQFIFSYHVSLGYKAKLLQKGAFIAIL